MHISSISSAADFAIQRVGVNAGRVHLNFNLSPASHYYIRAKVRYVKDNMDQVDFSKVTGNTAGNPYLAKAEIVALYSAFIRTPAALRCINVRNLVD